MYAIQIKNVVKEYKNGVQALSGLNLTVKQGVFFIVGSEWSRQIYANSNTYHIPKANFRSYCNVWERH